MSDPGVRVDIYSQQAPSITTYQIPGPGKFYKCFLSGSWMVYLQSALSRQQLSGRASPLKRFKQPASYP